MSAPLSNVRVLDLTRVLAGPWCTQTLADLGATVIKIEKPGLGDDTRSWGPPFIKDDGGRDIADLAAYFTCANRGKLSVAIDIAKPDGARLVRDLAAHCDVLVENFKTGGLAQYGLDYEAIRAVNPALVYCSVTGFGQTGPYAHRAGYDVMVQGLGGLMSLTGLPESEPVKAGVAVTDLMTGLYATVAIVAALPQAKASDVGQRIDIALLDVQVAALANQAAYFLVSGKSPTRMGNAHPSIVPYQVFEADDGYLVLNVGNDSQFRSFCSVIERPDWSADARYATNPARVAHRDVLCGQIAQILKARPVAVWLAALEKAGVPAAPINSVSDVFDDAQVEFRQLRLDLETGDGTIPGVRSPIRYSETPLAHDRPPPRLGQHTASVLKEVLGLDESAIEALMQAGVVR